ncbi:D-3-phosphoglycerate dehydrogenase, partial [Pseudolycoriella hygida]
MGIEIKNVLILDKVDDACRKLLEKHGMKVDTKLDMNKGDLCHEIKNYQAAIVRSRTKITYEILMAGIGFLKVVGRAGAGVDNISVEDATDMNVVVVNTPGANAIAACELTCLLISALARPFLNAACSMKRGNWNRHFFQGTELYGKTLAVIGLGRIGREVAKRMNAFGMKVTSYRIHVYHVMNLVHLQVIGYDPIVKQSDVTSYGVEKMELEEIWPLADYITVHTPLNASTKNFINADVFAKCKKGFKIVNVARGGIVNEEDLLESLESEHCDGVGVDVYTNEPHLDDTSKKLVQHMKTVATAHIGALTDEAQHHTMGIGIENVLILDEVDDACRKLLEKHGMKVDTKLDMNKGDLCHEIKNYQAAIVRSRTKITNEILMAGIGFLKVVGRAGAGVDNISVEGATDMNVVVVNTPGANTIAACELTCLLISALARPFLNATRSMKLDNWNRHFFQGTELYGKTLAVIGLGRIGREVAKRMNAFGMNVIGYDPIVRHSDVTGYGVEKMELEEIWPLADYITVHTPLNESTKNFINADVLAKCKKGFKIVNVARGGIVNEEDLVQSLESGHCGGVGVDVYTNEPHLDDTSKKLVRHMKTVATAHIGALTDEAQHRCAVELAEQIIALTQTTDEYVEYPGRSPITSKNTMGIGIENVLILDEVDDACRKLLEKHGMKVDTKLDMNKGDLCHEIKNYQAAIVRSRTKITNEILMAGIGFLKVVGSAGAGVDNISVEDATDMNVVVVNTPGANAIAACELTCLLISALARPFLNAGCSMKRGNWNSHFFQGTELYGKTLAVIGLGRIGREVAKRMNAFGMNVIGYDPIVRHSDVTGYGVEKMELEEIWPLADYITVHTPLNASTKNFINAKVFAKCKKGFKIVNVARGGIVNEEDLWQSLESGHCDGVGVDVYTNEPHLDDTSKKLVQHMKTVATAHIGALTDEAQHRCAVELAEQIIALTQTTNEYENNE